MRQRPGKAGLSRFLMYFYLSLARAVSTKVCLSGGNVFKIRNTFLSSARRLLSHSFDVKVFHRRRKTAAFVRRVACSSSSFRGLVRVIKENTTIRERETGFQFWITTSLVYHVSMGILLRRRSLHLQNHLRRLPRSREHGRRRWIYTRRGTRHPS